MKKKDETDTTCCVTVGDPWTAKQYHLKSEAKEDHQLDQATDIGAPGNQQTEMHSFRSGPS